MPRIAPSRSQKSEDFSVNLKSATITNLSQEALLNELQQLRQEKAYYKNQLAFYEKLHVQDKKELKNARASLNKHLAEELADSKLLQQISSKLIEAENVEQLYELIIDTAKAVMHSDAVSMHVYVSEKNALKLLAWRGFPPDAAKAWEWIQSDDVGTCALAMMKHKRIIIEDVENCQFLKESDNLAKFRLYNLRAMQSTPLISRSGELLGMISTHWEKVHQPSERDYALLDVIIRQAADLLERIRVHTVLRENKFWLNGQKEAFQAAMSGLPLTVSLKALLDTIITQTGGNGCARAAFYQIPPGSNGLHHIVGMSQEYAQDVKDFAVGPHSLACGLAMYQGEPVITPDTELDPDWAPLLMLTRKYQVRACWSFPVRTKDGPIVGTMGIYFSEPREPTSRELELAGVLTHAAAIIISRERELLERTQAVQALRESEKKLKTLVRLRDEFIGNASHELNTPLTSMMIYAQILEQQFNEIAHPRYTGMVKKLREQVDRLHILIRDMLDTTRLAEGKLQLKISRFNLNCLIQEKIENIHMDLKKHRLEVQLGTPGLVEADKERIGQVITNLISNAIKYSPPDSDILVSSEVLGDFIKVSVRDHGIGIPKEDLQKIFERFYRVLSNEARTFPGMGIGLSICKDIIDMHRGNLKAESQEGVGSTFSFVIHHSKQL